MPNNIIAVNTVNTLKAVSVLIHYCVDVGFDGQ